MKFSEEFSNKYEYNREMSAVVAETNKVLSPYFINDANIKDREIIYETIYAFKISLVDWYGLNMSSIYENLHYLENVIYYPKKERCCYDISLPIGYVFTKKENFASSKEYFTTIIINTTWSYGYKKTLIHLLIHLFTVEYTKDKNGVVYEVGRNGLENCNNNIYINEFMIQKITLDVLRILGYYDLSCVEDENTETLSIGIILDKLFGNLIYEEMFNHTKNFTQKLNELQNPQQNLMGLLDSLFKELLEAYHMRPDIYLYKTFLNILFQKIDKEHLNVADYLDIINEFDSKHLFSVGNFPQFSTHLCESKEIEYFYKVFNKKFNPKVDLIKEINPFTRSIKCTNFLILLNSLKTTRYMRSNMKQGNCDFNIDTLEKLDWKLVKGKSYEISLTYKYHNVDYFVVANINRQNGLVSIKESNALIIERIFKELSFIDKMKNRKPKFSEKYNLVFIGKFSQISDYSEVMIKNIKSHEKKVIHAIAIGDVETFNENIGKVNIKKIIDTNGNNLFHLLAINRRPNECISIFEDLIRLYGSDANDLFNTLNKSMESPINIAIDNHNLLFVEICCQYGLDIKNPIRYIRDKIYSKTLLDYLQFKRYYSAANSLEKNK